MGKFLFLSSFLRLFHQLDVVGITGILDFSGFKGIENGAFGLINMKAVMKLAFFSFLEDLREIMLYFFFLDVNHGKFTYTRSIDHVTAKVPEMHLSKSGGMLSF